MTNKKELLAYVPLISYILYSTAGPIIPQQSLVSYSFLGICCLFSAYSIIRIKRTRFSNWIFVFLSMQLLYFIITDKVLTAADGDPVYTWGFMKGIVWTFVPYFFAYYLASKGRLERKHIIVFCLVFLPLLSVYFFWSKVEAINKMAETGKILDDITNNVGYQFMHLLILLPLIGHKRMWTIVYMSIIAFFVLLSAKRGCIIISFLIILFYTPKWLKDRRNRKISIILIALLAIMVVMGIRYFSEYDYLTERLELMTEGYASSRDLIAEDIINYCFHTHFSFIKLLFGYGFNYSWCMAGQSAHNDWLELLASHGIMGIVVYAFFFINMFKECRRIKAYDLKQMSYLCIIVWFLSSLFSQGYGGASFVALMLGFVLGRSLYENNNLNNNKVIHINNKHNQTVSYVN